MSFAAPLQLAWLGLLVPLVVLYILRRRRDRRQVGSTLLWESALRDLGYRPRTTPLGEFLKAGGSAKCLTLHLNRWSADQSRQA